MYNKLKYEIEIASWFRDTPHAWNTRRKGTYNRGKAKTLVQIKLVALKNIDSWHTYFGHNSAILGPIGLKIYGNSGDYYLSISEEKVMMLTFNFWFFGPLLAGKWAWPTRTPLIFKPNQKVGPLDETSGPTTISLQNQYQNQE